MGGCFRGLKGVSEAKMILWAYLFMVYSNYLSTVYIKLPMIRKPHKIHGNLNPTKIKNYMVQH